MDGHHAPATVRRKRTDSSHLAEPRVLIRVFVEPGGLDASIAFYERLQDREADARFSFPAKNLQLAMVGAFLLIEGGEEDLRPFRSTVGTLLVDDVRPYTKSSSPKGRRSSSRSRRYRPGPRSTPGTRTARWWSTCITGRPRTATAPEDRGSTGKRKIPPGRIDRAGSCGLRELTHRRPAVELRRIELLTSCMPCRRSTN